MVFIFLFFLPFIFYLIKIQIIIGSCFFVWFCILYFIIFYVLNTEYIMSCKEIPLNTSKLISYTFINLFIFVPKANAFILFYSLLEFVRLKKKSNNIFNFIFFFLVFFLVFFLKISIFLVLGYSYLSLLITSNFVVKLFNLFRWNYENNEAMFETIVINCLVSNVDSVGKAEEKNIIIKQNEIIFNANNLEALVNFFKKVKNYELLLKAFTNSELTENKKIDNHYNFSIISKYGSKQNLSKNLTSNPSIKVVNLDLSLEEKEVTENVKCRDMFLPNLMGQNKPNFLTPTYELNTENALISKLDSNTIIKMQSFSKCVYNSIVLDAHQKIIISDKFKFYKKNDFITTEEYSKEYKMGISNNISDLNTFLDLNKTFFESEKNREEFKIIIKLLTNLDRDIIVGSDNKIIF